MSRMLNRRHVVGGLALASSTAVSMLASDRPAWSWTGSPAKLGASIESFETDLGRSTGALEGRGVFQFGEPEQGEIVHYVRFTNGNADHIEVDLTFLPGGGLPENEANIGNSRFLPEDAAPLASASGGKLQFDHEAYDFRTWSSQSLASETERTGNILVVDAHGVAGDGMQDPPPYTRATISMESFEIHPVTPNGDSAVLGAPLEEWFMAYGEGSSSQRATHVANPPYERLYLGIDYSAGGVSEVDLVLEDRLPISEAVEALGELLPTDAVLEQTFYAIPSPTGPIGLRTHAWSFPSSEQSAISMMYVHGDEETAEVSRILMLTAK